MSFLFSSVASSANPCAKSDGTNEKEISIPKPVLVRQNALEKASPQGSVAALSQGKAGVRRSMKPVKFATATKLSLTGSSNTAYNTVQALTPMNGLDGNSIAALFDQIRVESIDFWCRLEWSNAPAVGTGYGCVAYSPLTNTALSTAQAALLMGDSTGPIGGSLVHNPSSSSVTAHGFVHFRARVPKGTGLNPNTSTEIVGGSWFASDDNNAVVGYLLPYAEQVSSSTATLTIFIRYNMSARYRT